MNKHIHGYTVAATACELQTLHEPAGSAGTRYLHGQSDFNLPRLASGWRRWEGSPKKDALALGDDLNHVSSKSAIPCTLFCIDFFSRHKKVREGAQTFTSLFLDLFLIPEMSQKTEKYVRLDL